MPRNSNDFRKNRSWVKGRVIKASIAFLVLIGLTAAGQAVRADIAPPPSPEFGGLHAFQDTKVQMVYERVEMELEGFQPEAESETAQNRILVTAYFVMQNQGEVDESMQVVFPLDSDPYCFGVAEDAIGTSFTSYSIVQDSFTASMDGVLVPVTNIQTEYNGCANYPWAAFDVTFPVGQEVLIKVTYAMDSQYADAVQGLDYVLETGAGWYGPIGGGYIIVKFPYTITADAVLADATAGYQILHNEVFWSFQGLEPTAADNIHISLVAPDLWRSMQKLRETIKREPASPAAWLEMIGDYQNISAYHGGDIVRDDKYLSKIVPTFQQAIAANPNDAELHAQYARYLLFTLQPHLEAPLAPADALQILSLLNKAMALEASNETAQQTLSDLLLVAPSLTFTPPPTIPPSATPIHTSTPSRTPTATITPRQDAAPLVVTVIHTKVVYLHASTQIPEATATLVQPDAEQRTGSANMIPGVLVGLAIGGGFGFFLSRKQKK